MRENPLLFLYETVLRNLKNENIIYQTKPKVFNPFGILILFLIGAFFVYTSDSLPLKLIMGGIFITSLLIGLIINYYANGILITENKIDLIKTNWVGKTESEPIEFSEIKSIKWNHGKYRQDRAIYLKTINKPNIKVRIPDDPFKFGHILKFLNKKGIDIHLVHSDQELRMFIDDQITEFPMGNEKTA